METNSINIYDELSRRVLDSDEFQAYESLLRNEIIAVIEGNYPSQEKLTINKIKFLLKSISIFACSSKDENKQLAYSIAILLYSQYREIYNEIETLCSFILLRLGNFPAQLLMHQGRRVENSSQLSSRLPINLQIESASRSVQNGITIAKETVYLTDFQRDLFSELSQESDISFSAPTSAGKSFLLILYVVDLLKEMEEINILYIVPTKALINQVKNDFKKSFQRFELNEVQVLSSILSFALEDLVEAFRGKKTIFILTQERLSYLLSKIGLNLKFSLLIIDEAQKINDGNRGIVLERVIMQTISKFPLIKVVFSSPLASNPEFFSKYKLNLVTLKTNYSPVHQNVLFVNTNKKKDFISLLNANSIISIQKQSHLQKECPKSNRAKIAFVAQALGRNQSNILYANGPSDTEEMAKELCNYLPDVEHKAISDFIDFIGTFVHRDYSLIECLKKGVAFHYSTMPRELKERIEELFASEDIPITFLCCTSTLLEGMNLPAKNVFILKPTKGKGNKMSKFDFWNLAGRAGRLLKDFYGNIYCIDAADWGEDSYFPEKSLENYIITSATEDSLISKGRDLSTYLENIKELFPVKERELLEETASTFILNYIEDNGNTVGQFLTTRSIQLADLQYVIKIETSIKDISARNRLPKSILQMNSSIDPRLQNDLYSHFVSQFYTAFLPRHPASGQEFYYSLVEIYQLIDRIFLAESDKKILARYAVLSSQWMNETSLGVLIQSQIDYEKSVKKFISVNKCVREIVDIIERVLTFKYAKYLKCYIDILEHHLALSKINVSVLNIAAYLELGAFHPTTLSLLSFGISRTTAIRLRQIIGDNTLDRASCREWLIRNFQTEKDRLPKVCQNDFERNFE